MMFGLIQDWPLLCHKIIDYAAQQALIPRRYSVEELFDDTTRALN